MISNKDPLWDYWVKVIISGKTKWKCLYCKKHPQNNNAPKCRKHSLECKSVPDEVRKKIRAHEKAKNQNRKKRGTNVDMIEDEEDSNVLNQADALIEPSESQDVVMTQDSQMTLDNYLTKFNSNDVDEAIILFVKFLFSIDAAFLAVENFFLKKFFEKMNMQRFLPTRKQLSGEYLDKIFSEAENHLMQKINMSDYVALVIDGWENVNNLSVLNIMVASPKSYFYKSMEITGDSIDNKFLIKQMKQAIEEIGLEKISAVVCDNAKNMKKMQMQISAENPSIISINCAAHTLNLLIQDICRLNTAHLLINNGKVIIKEILKSKTSKGRYIDEWNKYVAVEKAKGNYVRKLLLCIPVATRWYAISDMMYRLLRNRPVLERMSIDKDSDLSRQCKTIIKSDQFWTEVQEFKTFLDPMIDGTFKWF